MIISVITIIIFIAIAISLYSFFIGAPIFLSPHKAIREALKFCEVKPGMKFCDLGAGTGRSMIVAAKEYEMQISGYELSPILNLWARLNLRLHGVRNFWIKMRNFYTQDFSDADVIFCFLTPPAMVRLKNKFRHELRPGTMIISYSFSIPEWEPIKVIEDKGPGKVFIYKI
jgi:tRNA A58 N-methylase Trm61